MEMLNRYFNIVSERFQNIVETQEETLETIKNLVKETIKNDRLIYLFGSGHSHATAEEFFCRAGGFACVSAILEEPLMVHTGGMTATVMERLEGYAKIAFSKYNCKPEDILFIFSNSGINAAPVEMAQEAKKIGMTVVCFTSLAHSKSQEPRHSSGLRLCDVADICLDTGVPPGDATIELPNGVKTAPISTMMCVPIVHGMFAQAAHELCQEGIEPPVFFSANVKGGDEKSAKLVEKYKSRVRCM